MDLVVNEIPRTLPKGPADRPLLFVLRNELALTGTKYGCGEGHCGACTVLVGGKAVRSCITPLSKVGAQTVTTIEGLARGETLHPIQQAFLDEGAFQCGYCTPGMILAAVDLLARLPRPTDNEIRQGMEGNVCRCGGHPRILAALRRAAGPAPEPTVNTSRK